MRMHRSVCAGLIGVMAAAGWGPPQKAEKPGDIALKEKGLTKTGTAYTIEAEKPVLARMKEARTAYAAFAAMSGQQVVHQELALRAGQLEDQRAELQTQLDELNQQINDGGGMNNQAQGQGGGGPMGGGGGGPMGGPGGGMNRSVATPLTIERDRIKGLLTEVAAEQKTVRNQSPQAKDTAALDARVKKADEAVKAILADLRAQVDEVIRKYGLLEAEEPVRAALAEAKKGNPKLHIGPSDAFNAGVKELGKAEQQVLGKRATAASSKKKARSKR